MVKVVFQVDTKPVATHYTIEEGGEWKPWFMWSLESGGILHRSVFAIKFDDGTIWDCLTGWRNARS